MRNKRKMMAGVGLISLIMSTTAVSAADIDDVIIVTAQKRAEDIQSVPITMQAFTANEIARRGVTSSTEVFALIPNASTNVAAGDSQFNFYIRGVGDSNFHVNSNTAIGVYADEVTLNSPVSWSFPLFDLERIEVLRGPQNTLFGRNTTGGAVSYISAKPSLEGGPSGFSRFTAGRYSQFDVESALNLPLSDTAALRIAGMANTRDDIQENKFLGVDGFDKKKYAARAQLLWRPLDRLEVLLNGHFGLNRGSNHAVKTIGTRDPNDPTMPCALSPEDWGLGQPCADAGGFVDTGDALEVFANMPNARNDIDSYGGFVNINWDLGFANLTAITAYEDNKLRRSNDVDGGPHAFFELHQSADADQWSQEIRLTSPGDTAFRWIVGGLYFNEKAKWVTAARTTGAPPPIGGALPGSPAAAFTLVPTTIIDQDDNAVSIYGQTDWDITDKLTFTVGGRYSWEEKDGFNDTLIGRGALFPIGAFLGEAEVKTNPIRLVTSTPLSGDWNEWGGRVAISYDVNDNAMLFASVSRGFKTGGFSAAALQAIIGQAARQVDEETLLTYEGGLKTKSLDGRLLANASVFYNNWKDMQIFSVLLEGGQILPLLLNIPKAASWGAELELQFEPQDGLIFQGAVGWLDSEVKDATSLPTISEGNTLPYSPHWTVNALVRKEWTLSEDSLLTAQFDAAYVGDQSYDIENKPEFNENQRTILNARLSYIVGNLDFGLWGKNLTGKTYCDNIQELRSNTGSIKCLQNDGVPIFGGDVRVSF